MWQNQISVYQQKFNDEEGIFFTPEEFPEILEHPEDVSPVLMKALAKLVKEQHYGILYIPEGEYRIRHTILIPRAVRLIGYGKKRPVFILPEGTEGFEGENLPDTDQTQPANDGGYPGAGYMFWFIGDTELEAEEIKDANAGTFYSALTNIDFKIEQNNPGAICIRSHFAQHGFISHCHFDLGDGLAGIYDVGNEMEDLTFEGGQYGIVCRMCSPGWPFALLDCRFANQKKAAIQSSMTGFTAFRLRICNTPKAFDLFLPDAWEKLYLEDCVFENITDAAITSRQSTNVIQQTNIRNLCCKNVPTLIRRVDTGDAVCREEEIYRVEEYAWGYMMENGKKASWQEVLCCAQLQELDEISKGDIPALAPMEQWVSVKKYGAVGDGETDDTEALRKAVQAEKILYFPQGIYRVTDTIVLPEGVSLYGFHPATTQIILIDDTPAFEGFGTPKAVIETAAGGFACINGIGIDTAGKNPRAVGVKWMAGEHSYMNDVKFMGGHGLMFRDGRNAFAYLYNPSRTGDYDPDRVWDYQYSSLWITNQGGGIFKDVWSASPYAEAGIAITNTCTRGRMYAISLEHHARNEMKLHNVENWSVYALQTEEEKAEGMRCLPLELVSCRHILIANYYLFRVIAVDRNYETGIRVWDSSDILFLNLENKAQMQFTFMLTLKDENTGFYAKSPEYAKLYLTGEDCEEKKNTVSNQQSQGSWKKLAGGFDFAQGAALDKKGNLYWCDKAEKRIYRYDCEKGITLPLLDIHFTPAAVAVDSQNHLLVAVDYSELKKTIPGQPFQTHDTKNYHPFFSWFYKRSEKAYAVDIEHPFDSMVELKKVPAVQVHPEVVYRPAELDYPGIFAREAIKEIAEYYMAPDGKTALQGTIDLGRCVGLAAAIPGENFVLTDDAGHCAYAFHVTEGGNLTDGRRVATRGQYTPAVYKEMVWTVEDNLYGFSEEELAVCAEIPEDVYQVISDGTSFYLIGRSAVYTKTDIFES